MIRATQYTKRPTSQGLTVNKLMFINQLKVKYKNLVDKFQALPFIQNKHSVSTKPCIASGIEFWAGSCNWTPVDSYQDIVGDHCTKFKRRILIGEAGYGKSTVTLQIAHDWCQNTHGTYLQDVEILIFLRLGQLRGVNSVYEAIRKFALPKISTLSDKDIKAIIEGSTGVLFVLDAFGEYSIGKIESDSDIMKIMRNEMLQRYKVIFTARVLPEECPSETERFRLTGTDEQIQDEYIRRTLVCEDSQDGDRIRFLLRKNPVISGVCQIPFFFVMYANLTYYDKAIPNLKTVTSFLKYIVDRFLNHTKKSKEYLQKHPSLTENHLKLDEIAFDGLFNKDRKVTWSKMEMCNKLGVDVYDVYVESGILIEEAINNARVTSGTIPTHYRQIEVQFRHRIFCEWYAAHYLATQGPTLGFQNFMERLSKISVSCDKYLYRFVCGVNHGICKSVIKYVTKRHPGNTILCILELNGQIEYVSDTVNDLCSREIEINIEQSKLLQEATVELLRTTFNKRISVSRLRLRQIFDFVNLSSEPRLQFQLSPPPIKLSRLTVWENGRVMNDSDIREVFEYSSKCVELKELRFSGCLLPKLIGEELLCLLESTNVEVWWFPGLYRLDLASGLWERPDLHSLMTDEDYWREEQYIQNLQ